MSTNRTPLNAARRCVALLALLAAAHAAHGTPVAPAVTTVPAVAVATGASDRRAEWCKRLSPRLPKVSTLDCIESGIGPTGAYSLQQFPILGRRIDALPPQLSGRNPKADEFGGVGGVGSIGHKRPVRILLLGGMHGDELTASAIVFKWLRFMDTPTARQFSWSIVPVLNPDGLLAKRPMRVNANGVDLNRNFPTAGWQQEAPRHWKQRARSDPRRFPGHAPLSEPESLWLDQEIERFNPQVIISVHAPFGVLDFDGRVEPPQRFGRLLLDQVGVYPGSLGNYGGLHKNVPVITIELPNARAMPSEAETRRIWQDMLKWISTNVEPEHAPLPTPTVSAEPQPFMERAWFSIRDSWDRVRARWLSAD